MTTIYFHKDQALKMLYDYKEWIRLHFFQSLLIFIITHIIGCIFIIPGSLFAMISGIIFATFFKCSFLGFIFCVMFYMVTTSFAGLVTFMLATCTLRNKLRMLMMSESESFKKIETLLISHGTKALFLFRLSPIVPVTIFNYIVSAFSSKIIILKIVTKLTYFLSSFGSFPSEIFYCYIGYSAINLQKMLNSAEEYSKIY